MVPLSMAMPVMRIQAHDLVAADRGRLAVERGPILYCAEGVDNAGRALDVVLAPDASFADCQVDVLGHVFPALAATAERVSGEAFTLKLVPYFAWCHRGAGEMQTWFATSRGVLEGGAR